MTVSSSLYFVWPPGSQEAARRAGFTVQGGAGEHLPGQGRGLTPPFWLSRCIPTVKERQQNPKDISYFIIVAD